MPYDKHTIDLRSDAVTQPTEAMWEAMRWAAPGWAPAGDDPAVLELEDYTMALTGKTAAIFVPTGTMANLAALMAFVEHGDQVVLEESSHILWSEEWGISAICGAVPRALPGERGCLRPADVLAAIDERRFSHRPRTALVCLENTHNATGGAALGPDQLAAVADAAHGRGVPVHLDGARLLNACVALGVTPAAMCAQVDTVAIGLGKGLSAPYGALLCGHTETIARARVAVKRLGGHSVPNAGRFAAAGLVALRDMPAQLADDHRRAKDLAFRLVQLPGLSIELQSVQTNIVMARVVAPELDAPRFLELLAAHGVRAVSLSDQVVRFVTHRHIGDAEVIRATEAAGAVLAEVL
jgi:threonine aldolase